jgi:hypothetical protein
MTRDTFTRRTTLRALTGALLLATPALAVAASDSGAPLEKGEPKADGPESGKADGGATDSANRAKPDESTPKPSRASLTVIVTGNGNPVAKAEVVLLDVAPSGGDDLKDFTDGKGEAVFSDVPVNGTTTVRVIVPGWVTAMQDVVLERGSQQVNIALKPKGHDM